MRKENFGPSVHDDSDKVTIRRLDWRFLLETPTLGRTLFVGESGTDLVHALERFCSELHVVASIGTDALSTMPTESYDLAVVSGVPELPIQALLPHLRDGAFVYWESQHSSVWPIHRHPNRFAAKLREMGLDDVRTYWFRPSFSACREIIPLDERVALGHAFDKVHEDLLGRLKMALGKAVLLSGALPYVAQSFGVVARKSAPRAQSGT